jgi:fructose/tagatose bisphosphate aldolase
VLCTETSYTFEIQKIVNGQRMIAPLIVHGGTDLKPEVVKRLVALGSAKFNVSTDLKYAPIDVTYDAVAGLPTEPPPDRRSPQRRNMAEYL